jgi:WD40 repeat protein
MRMRSYYELLEISRSATDREIRDAYKLQAFVWHPDRFPAGTKAYTAAQARMKEINLARELLLDPVRRRKYDEELSRSTASAATTSRTAPSDAHQQRPNEFFRIKRGGPIRTIVFSPNDSLVLATGGCTSSAASAFFNSYVRRASTITGWELQTKRRALTLGQFHPALHGRETSALAFSPNGATLLSGGADDVLRLWDVHTHSCIATLRGHTCRINSVAFDPSGAFAVSASSFLGETSMLRLWDVSSIAQIGDFFGHTGSVFSVSFSRNGQFILSASADKTARIWLVESRDEVSRFDHNSYVLAAAMSPSGDFVATATAYGHAITVWDVAAKRVAFMLEGHESTVRSLTFSPCGRRLLSGSGGEGKFPSMDGKDNSARIWDLDTQKETFKFAQHSANFTAVAFSHDGSFVAAGDYCGDVRVWELPVSWSNAS